MKDPFCTTLVNLEDTEVAVTLWVVPFHPLSRGLAAHFYLRFTSLPYIQGIMFSAKVSADRLTEI